MSRAGDPSEWFEYMDGPTRPAPEPSPSEAESQHYALRYQRENPDQERRPITPEDDAAAEKALSQIWAMLKRPENGQNPPESTPT